MMEHYFSCLHCWIPIPAIGYSRFKESYMEDWEVYFNPIQVTVEFFDMELIDFQADSLDQ